MRRFWITNKNNSTVNIDLMSEDSYGAGVDGLGIETESDNFMVGASLIPYNNKITYQEISFTVIFGYVSEYPYYEFNRFIKGLDLNDLVLHYSPKEGEEHHRRVRVKSISKSEINYTINALASKVVFTPLGPWITVSDCGKTLQNITAEGAQRRVYRLRTTGCLPLQNGSTIPFSFTWKCNTANSPVFYIRLYDSKHNLVSQCSFFTNQMVGQYFHYNSDYSDLYARVGASSDPNDSALRDVAKNMDSNSTGWVRLLPNQTQYLYIGVEPEAMSNFEVQLESVVV